MEVTVVKELRERFKEGKTKGYEWRVSQLEGIERMINEREKEIMEALWSDLSKPRCESYVHEVSLSKAACTFALKQLKSWMKPKKVASLIATFSSTSQIVAEPLGVILVISTWNYPFSLSIDPIIGAVAAGNCVVLKPSEIAPATSAFFGKYLPEYVDNSCIKVVQVAHLKLLHFWNRNGIKYFIQVAMKRIAVGKWGCNNGQACIAPDYIITTKAFAPKLLDALKGTLEDFYGKTYLEL